MLYGILTARRVFKFSEMFKQLLAFHASALVRKTHSPEDSLKIIRIRNMEASNPKPGKEGMSQAAWKWISWPKVSMLWSTPFISHFSWKKTGWTVSVNNKRSEKCYSQHEQNYCSPCQNTSEGLQAERPDGGKSRNLTNEGGGLSQWSLPPSC